MPRAVLTIDLDAIAANYLQLCRRAGDVPVAGVVKADAYGLGADRVARRLWQAGCRAFFVAKLGEGEALRTALPDATIYVLEGVDGTEVDAFLASDLMPVLNTRQAVALWAAAGECRGRRLPAAAHIDTGMCRLGLSPADLAGVDSTVWRAIDVRLVLSHLACADEPAQPLNAAQLQRFREAATLLSPAPRSLANSAGLFLGSEYFFDLVRPGAALYGINPTPGRTNPMQPVVRLSAPVLQVRSLDASGTVGYGATYRVAAGSRIATVGVGYADGYVRGAGVGPGAFINGREVPIVGRISMDLMTLDVSALREDEVDVGTTVELLAGAGGIDAVAAAAGTIGYELLTRLGHRFHRAYCERDIS